MRSPLRRILPVRTSKGGVRPGVSASPSNDEHWKFPSTPGTEYEERLLVATAIQIGVIVMMNTHQYTFDGKTFLQRAGGPIGLRATCAVARVTMNTWDFRFQEVLAENNLEMKTGCRYMDDVRVFLYAIKAGWRWWDGRLCFSKEWEDEDLQAGKSDTRRILLDIMNSMMFFLRVTLEIGVDSEGNKLPTLDLSLWVLA